MAPFQEFFVNLVGKEGSDMMAKIIIHVITLFKQ